jgi:bifunctional NMN adenylyltransferase/nudix hydrolase
MTTALKTTLAHDILVATVVGRFMLAHEAHRELVQTAIKALKDALQEGRAKAVRLVIVLGSAYHARTPKNPFTWVERKNMLLAALAPADRDLVSFVPVRDYHDDDRWARVVHRKVAELVGATAHIQVFGHYKDASSAYLNDCFHQWEVIPVPKLGDLDATTLRAMLFAGDDDDVTLSALEGHVPQGIRQYLKVWMQQPCYASLKEEFAVLREEKVKYGYGPFVAGDGIYRTKTHVLLIERKFHPGRGLLAIPGGFLEVARRETPRQCAEREGVEETHLGVLKSTLASAYRASEVFAHPDRSVRGNVISHAFFYDFDSDTCPEVTPDDDAGKAIWVPIADLRSLEDRFYDDHFLVLDFFLGILDKDE